MHFLVALDPGDHALGARAGQDALIGVELTLEEICFGTERELTVETAIRCDKCGGTGCADNTKPEICGICKGRGEIQQVTRSFIGNVMTSRPCNNCGWVWFCDRIALQ